MVCVCVLFSTPLVFIVGSHGVRPLQPIEGTYEEATRGLVEAVGPTGQFGRPGWSAVLSEAPTIPNFLWWAVLGCLVWSTLVLVCLGLSELGS